MWNTSMGTHGAAGGISERRGPSCSSSYYIYGSAQDCSNSSALAILLHPGMKLDPIGYNRAVAFLHVLWDLKNLCHIVMIVFLTTQGFLNDM